MAWLFLTLSLAGACLTYNVYRPLYSHKQLSTVSWIAGWITGELALHWVGIQALITIGFIAGGVLSSGAGQLALGITLVSWVLLGYSYLRARSAVPALEQALRELEPEVVSTLPRQPDWRRILQPLPLRRPEVERISGIQYHRARGVNLKLDVYRSRSHPTRSPVLLQIHGGAWVFGSRTNQALPLMHQMAARGWVCVSADYRLSPHATFPEHLIDCKQAIHWIRENVADYGGDPDFIVVTGGSAGGHLCALLALTADDPEYQPGFEDVSTRVQGAVSFYGVYDFVDRHGDLHHQGMSKLLERSVLKAAPDEAPEQWERASPLARVASDAPPFFVIHGDSDTLVPVASARRFAAALREKSLSPVLYAEIPGAQHAFELFYSLRTFYALQAVEQFCASLHGAYLRGA